MKTLILFALAYTSWFAALAQQPPVNDTLIPKQHKGDTIQYEPKLEGGALIDTINTKDAKKHYAPAYIGDTLIKKDSTRYEKKKK
jgi:hypothetical protein